MIRLAVIVPLTLAAAIIPAAAAPAGYGEAFVGAFAAACVPERLSYTGTKSNAEELGWTAAERTAHPELAALLARMEAGLAEAADMQPTFDYQLYARPVAGADHYLVVSRSSFVMDLGSGEDASEPEVWASIGCYLYNFDAAEPIDPAPMTALIEKPIAHAVDQDGIVGHVWGPPCPMPRTGDSYLTFIAEGSPAAAQTGFSGLMVKFETSEPEAGEVVPATYCTDDAPTQN